MSNLVEQTPSQHLVNQSVLWDVERLWQMSQYLAASEVVPAHFRNKPESVFPMLQLAIELQASPLTVLQNTFMISGKPGFSAKLAVSLCNRAKKFAGPIRWKVEKGDKPEDLTVTAYAPTYDGDTVDVTVDMRMAASEGWTKNPKYKTIPEMMLRWRSASWLINLYCPEILLGMEAFEQETQPQPQRVVEVRVEDTKPTTSLGAALERGKGENDANTANTEGESSRRDGRTVKAGESIR